jgi:hypothetical protein
MRALVAIFLFCIGTISAQSFHEEVTFALAESNIELFAPLEQASFALKKDHNSFFKTDFQIVHTDKVEVRVEVMSYPQDSLKMSNPHINNGVRLGHLIDNINDDPVTLHKLGSEDLDFFGADWATQSMFNPKDEFSPKKNCQLITLFKEEVGLIFLYLLFDDIEKYKDEWRYLIGFGEEEVVPGG